MDSPEGIRVNPMALPYSISRGHYLPLQALVPCFGLDNSDASLLIFDHKIELTIF
jgi:hypothetical protein